MGDTSNLENGVIFNRMARRWLDNSRQNWKVKTFLAGVRFEIGSLAMKNSWARRGNSNLKKSPFLNWRIPIISGMLNCSASDILVTPSQSCDVGWLGPLPLVLSVLLPTSPPVSGYLLLGSLEKEVFVCPFIWSTFGYFLVLTCDKRNKKTGGSNIAPK